LNLYETYNPKGHISQAGRRGKFGRAQSGGNGIAICALVSLALVACGPGGGTTTSQTVLIGVTGPLSGPYAALGQDLVDSATVRAKEINQAGGVLGGRKLEIVAEDDQCDAQVAVQAATLLVEKKVIAIDGGYCSGATIPESTVLRSNGNLPILTTAVAVQLTEQGYDNVFRLFPRSDYEGPLDVAFMSQILKVKRVAIMHDNLTYGKSIADSVSSAATAAGLQVVYFDAITPGQKDYSSALTKVGTTNPDVLIYTGYYGEGAAVAKSYKDLGLDKRFAMMGGVGLYDPGYLQGAGSSANGTYVMFAAVNYTGSDADTFTKDYKAATGRDLATLSVYQADGITALAKAIEQCKCTNSPDLGKALHAQSFTGITGLMQFDSKGDRKQFPLYEYVVENGAYVPQYKWDTTAGQWVKI
jgi:branched-chain amino acid transport system substrate-binding protein